MAHPCACCGGECFCSGDIDDAVVSLTPVNCEGCGCEDDYEPWEEGDEDAEWVEDDVVGYHCLGCGHIQDHPGECDICTGSAVEGYG